MACLKEHKDSLSDQCKQAAGLPANSNGGSAPSAADHWDDMIRGVDTLNDPNGGTTQLSNLGQYHFTDGFGNYRTTDDPNYTPEKAGEVGTWTQMTAVP